MSTLYQELLKNIDSKEVALTFMKQKISYHRFFSQIDNFASALFAYGIKKDDVVTILSPNIPEAIYSFYALSKIGAIIHIVHPLTTPTLLKKRMEETNAKLLIMPDLRYHEYENLFADFPLLLINVVAELRPLYRKFYPLVYRHELAGINKNIYLHNLPLSAEEVAVNTDENRNSLYLNSGGTTGTAKTIILRDESINSIARLAVGILDYQTPEQLYGKKMLAVLPMFHGFGLAMGIHAPLTNNATAALMVRFSPKVVTRMIKHNELNYIITIPYLTNKLLSLKSFRGRGLQNLSHAFMGGDKSTTDLFTRFNNVMKKYHSQGRLLEGYGLTEVVTVNTVNTLASSRLGSLGLPLKGVTIRITDLNDSSKILPPFAHGMIEISTPSLMQGYLHDEKLTSEVITRTASGEKYLVTGDIGYLDEDGYLFFVDRKKSIFIIAGINVFPSSIESIATSFPEVNAAVAKFNDNKVHPFITLHLQVKKVAQNEELKKLIINKLKEELIKYAVPEQIIFHELFPLTSLGKIDKDKII